MKMIALAGLLLATQTASAARPLSLAEAVETAFRTEPLLAQARLAKERTKLGVLRAQLDRVSVRVDGTINEQFNKRNIGGPPVIDPNTSMPLDDQTGIGVFDLRADVRVPIFSGLRVESTVKRAQKADELSVVAIRQQRRDVALSVARAYWAVRRLQLMYQVQLGALDKLREAETVAEGRVKAGLAPPIDRNRAQLRRLQQTATLADLAGQVREAHAQLAVALGINEEIVLTDDAGVPDAAPPTADDLLSEARGTRPELRTAALNLELQRQNVRIAASGYYPQVTGQMLFQVTNNAFNPLSGVRFVSSNNPNPFDNLAGNLVLNLTLTQNFFDMLSTWTAHRDARYEFDRLREEQRRFGRLVESEVRVTQARVQRLFQRRAPLVEAREVARDNLKILEARYKNGDALVFEYLDGTVDLINAEQSLADVSAQLKLAWLELDASLGRVVGVER
jgi:outer membrane protein